jgi:hypothetical protein
MVWESHHLLNFGGQRKVQVFNNQIYDYEKLPDPDEKQGGTKQPRMIQETSQSKETNLDEREKGL